MENKKRIVSTVIIGIFLAISIYFVVILFTFNLKENLQRLSDSATERADGQPGAVVAVGFAAGLAGATLIIMAYLFAIAPLINSSICIIFSIKNRKSCLKPVRIINYVYDGLLGFIIIFTIIKIILFATGVA